LPRQMGTICKSFNIVFKAIEGNTIPTGKKRLNYRSLKSRMVGFWL
jgi:hypothetical protein